MEITYQGLRIQLPFEGVIGIESFSMDASFNEHVSVELELLVEEETIEPAIHGIADGDGIEVHEDGRDGILFAGNMPLRGCGWRKYNCSPVYSAIPPPELFSK